MRRFRRRIVFAFTVFLGACNDDPTNPSSDAIPGVRISASASGGDAVFLSAVVTLRNVTTDTVTVNYPAGCPVRLKFFRENGALPVFNEQDMPCDLATVVPLAIPPLATRTLTSGFRSPNTILGDSIATGRYDVTVILRIVGGTPIEIHAGTLQLRSIATAGPRARRQ